jgi:hypothetical protein
MFEKLMQAAEQAATGVSRRDFFGRLGRMAMVAAAAAAGVAASAGEAQAGRGCPQGTHQVRCPHGARPASICCPPGKRCGGCDFSGACHCV